MRQGRMSMKSITHTNEKMDIINKFILFFTPAFLIFISTFNFSYSAELKKPGYFGFTRGCILVIDEHKGDTPLCITSMTGFFALDVFLSPFQTIAKIINNINEDDKASNTKTSSTSQRDYTKEVPEERKVLSRLSLFHAAAADAREYVTHQMATPLLTATLLAMNSLYPIQPIDNVNLTEEITFQIQARNLIELDNLILNLMEENGGELK